jgi:hypothetical protein
MQVLNGMLPSDPKYRTLRLYHLKSRQVRNLGFSGCALNEIDSQLDTELI